jgi:Zn-dependent membrane protease YugP
VGWRTWAVKFGSAMPAFTTIVMFFAIAVRAITPGMAIGIVAASLGLATIFLWLTLPVERAAASAVSEMLEETPLVLRKSEGEKLANLVRASVWRKIVPGAVAWIGGK